MQAIQKLINTFYQAAQYEISTCEIAEILQLSFQRATAGTNGEVMFLNRCMTFKLNLLIPRKRAPHYEHLILSYHNQYFVFYLLMINSQHLMPHFMLQQNKSDIV
jgi:hypothetical protein